MCPVPGRVLPGQGIRVGYNFGMLAERFCATLSAGLYEPPPIPLVGIAYRALQSVPRRMIVPLRTTLIGDVTREGQYFLLTNGSGCSARQMDLTCHTL